MHPVHIPHEQVNDESVMLVEWLAKDGSQVTAGQPIATIETSKATTQIEAPQAGYLRHAATAGTEVPVGAVFCHIAEGQGESVTATPAPAVQPVVNAAAAPAMEAMRTTAPEPPQHHAEGNGKSTPLPRNTRFSRKALLLIEKHGLSPELFKGRAMVRDSDVLALVGGKPKAPAARLPVPAEKAAPATSGPIPAAGVPVRSEDLPRRKRVEGRYLASGAEHTLASVVSVLCPAAGLNAALKLQPDLGRSATAVIIYEAARLLRKYPVFNAFYDAGKINYYEQVNVGLAVDAGQGLKVPVIPQADKKGVIEIAHEMENLLLAYLSDEIPVAALAGGTFTITDLSSEDVVTFHPLINQGQAAILGVGAPYRPGGSGDGFFHLILAFDHQLTEGRTAALFLKELRDRIDSYAGAQRSGAGDAVCFQCGRTAADPETGGALIEASGADGQKGLICKTCLLG